MVESALEVIRICESLDFHNLVISLKASRVPVMLGAYRLLAQRMDDLGMDYPLHLGVTEAGDGEYGRIKSTAGIGTLLAEGIGDTIRVSLTEAPEKKSLYATAFCKRWVCGKQWWSMSLAHPVAGRYLTWSRSCTKFEKQRNT